MSKSFLIAAASILATFTCVSAATSLPIAAGEHGAYSRIVIPNVSAEWSIATTGRTIEIAISDSTTPYDLSDILQKRKAHRILGARISKHKSGQTISLSLTCDCFAQARRGPENNIVIDIFDNTSMAENNVIENKQTVPPIPNAQSRHSMTELDAVRDRMASLLAEATNQGMIQLRKSRSSEANVRTMPAPSITPPAPQVSADSQQDMMTAKPPRVDALDCAIPEKIVIDDENPRKSRYDKIHTLRDMLANAPEDERREIEAKLAYLYLHAGFFEEASAIARAHGQTNDKEMDFIASLAELGGARNANAKQVLAKFGYCGPLTELLAAAANAQSPGGQPSALNGPHLEALQSITLSLQGPVAEVLALDALDKNNTALARTYFEIATNAYGGLSTPTLVVLANKLRHPADENTTQHKLKEIAQTPGPMQSRALADLADEYAGGGASAYDGFFDDLISQSGNLGASNADARVAFASVRALVSAGQVDRGISVLSTLSKTSPSMRKTSEEMMRSLLLGAFSKASDADRILVINSFLPHGVFLERKDEDRAINLTVARELAQLGAPALVDQVLETMPAQLRTEGEAIIALAHLNAGAVGIALSLAKAQPQNSALTEIATRAGELNKDSAAVKQLLKRSIQRGEMTESIAKAAWRTGDWPLAIDAYALTPLSQTDHESAKYLSLASLMVAAPEMPAIAQRVFSTDLNSLQALSHMFNRRPNLEPGRLEKLSAFASGVHKETQYIKGELENE